MKLLKNTKPQKNEIMKNEIFVFAFFFLFLSNSGAQSAFQISGDFIAYDMAIDCNDNRLITGTVINSLPHDFDPSSGIFELPLGEGLNGASGYIASYNENGDLNVAFQITDHDIDPEVVNYLVETDGDNNIYIIGAFRGKADFDPSEEVFELSAPTIFETRSFLASYDGVGNFRFAIPFPHLFNVLDQEVINNSVVNKILSVDEAGNSYLLAWPFSGDLEQFDFDPGPGEFFITGGNYVFSYDDNGNFRFGYPAPLVTVDIGGNEMGDHYILGSLNPSIDDDFDFDPSPDTFLLEDVTGNSFFFAAYDSQGQLKFVND